MSPTQSFPKRCGNANKIGSTSRIGPDEILPFLKFDHQSLSNIDGLLKRKYDVRNIDKDANYGRRVEDLHMNCLLDKSFTLASDSDCCHMYSLNEIDSNHINKNFKTKSGLKLKTVKIDVIASSQEIDHLPSRSIKNMLSEFWEYLN